MSVRHIGLMLVLVTLAVAGCRQSSSYEVLGKDLLEVKAPGEGLGRAISDAAFALAQSVSTQPDSRYYPSLAQRSQYWGTKDDPNISRSITTFTDTSGRAVRIETIRRRGSSVLVFIECEAPGDPLVVLNQITKALEKAGVRGP